MSNRVVMGSGMAVAGGLAYYLYQAGGDPKVAEKKFEHDAARITHSVKGDASSKGTEIKTEAKVLGQEAGSKIDSAISQAKKQTSEIDARLEAYRRDAEKNIEKYSKEANKDFNSAVNKFDKTVEDGIARARGEVKESEAKAKSTWGSWFGGK